MEFRYTKTMGRPKNAEETKPLHTRLTTSQREAFDEYMRREQARMPRGAQLAEAAVLRGMVLRCLDLEGIPYVGAQQTLFSSPRAPVEEPPPPVVEAPAPPPPPPPVVEEPPPPSSPTEKASKARTAIGVAAEPVKTSAKKTKSATTSTAPAKKAKASPPPAASARASTKSATTAKKVAKSAPAKKTKKGAR